MSVVSLNELWEFLTKLRVDLLKAIPKVEDAIVVGLTEDNEPILRFIGETDPSQKSYPHNKSYEPAIGDRVQLLNGVIQGGRKPS